MMPEPLTAGERMRNGKRGIVVQHRDRAMAWMVAANLAKELGHELKDQPPVGMMKTQQGKTEWFFVYEG